MFQHRMAPVAQVFEKVRNIPMRWRWKPKQFVGEMTTLNGFGVVYIGPTKEPLTIHWLQRRTGSHRFGPQKNHLEPFTTDLGPQKNHLELQGTTVLEPAAKQRPRASSSVYRSAFLKTPSHFPNQTAVLRFSSCPKPVKSCRFRSCLDQKKEEPNRKSPMVPQIRFLRFGSCHLYPADYHILVTNSSNCSALQTSLLV